MGKLNQRWKNIQGNMALEGHYISDEELERIAAEYEASGEDQLIYEAAEIAEESGRSVAEVVLELLGERGRL